MLLTQRSQNLPNSLRYVFADLDQLRRSIHSAYLGNFLAYGSLQFLLQFLYNPFIFFPLLLINLSN